MDTARLEVRVDRQTLEALGRLARHRGLTIGATVEQAIGEACRAMVDSPGAGDAKAVAEPARALSSDGQPLKSWRDRFREMAQRQEL
jgi:post-segregation antitoxin (ccd killing protein)